MSSACNTTPLTEMLGLYRRLSAIGSRNLTAHLRLANTFARRPDEISSRFALSVAQFARYRNVDQDFHHGGRHAAVPPPPTSIRRTVDFAAHLAAAGCCAVTQKPELAFSYVDREPDCMRTKPGQLLEDGMPSKKAIVADLFLRNCEDARPIVAELKSSRTRTPSMVSSKPSPRHRTSSPRRNAFGCTTSMTIPSPLPAPLPRRVRDPVPTSDERGSAGDSEPSEGDQRRFARKQKGSAWRKLWQNSPFAKME